MPYGRTRTLTPASAHTRSNHDTNCFSKTVTKTNVAGSFGVHNVAGSFGVHLQRERFLYEVVARLDDDG
jgi:hypothetical protein